MKPHLEKQETVLLKVFLNGGSVMYFAMKWDNAQITLREFKYFLLWKYMKPTEENQAKLIEQSEFKRAPFINYFFLREDGELDGVLDFASISGIGIDEIPKEPEKNETIEIYKEQLKVSKEVIEEMKKHRTEGNDWKKEDEGEE